MSRRTKGAVWVVRLAFLGALAIELVALHFPAPSGVSEERRADVEGAWTAVGRAGRAGARHVPDTVTALVAPIVDDKTIHVLLFLPLGLLAATERRLHGPLTWRVAGLLMLGLTIYAAIGEATQVLGGRYPDPGDWLANAVGALLGIGATALFTRSPRRAPANPRPSRAP